MKNIKMRVKEDRARTYIQRDRLRPGVIFLRCRHRKNDLQSQEALCRTYCAENEINVVDVYEYLNENVADPAEFKSWGLAPILEYCQSNPGKIEVLVVANRDILGTNTADYLKSMTDLLREGVDILSATDVEPFDSSIGEICAVIEEYRNEKII